MNENLRTAKIKHGENLNKVRRVWWWNFALGALITAPLFVFPLRRMFLRNPTGVPFYFRYI
jgi:hypothetical protein